MNYTTQFQSIYSEFMRSDLFKSMEQTVENNDWHLESNVGVHTDMVVRSYLEDIEGDMSKPQFLGALACMFHDIGKPIVCEEIVKDDGTIRLTSPGHELESARLAEDYMVTNYQTMFSMISPSDITRICWLIQNHLFYRISKKDKLRDLRTTSRWFVSHDVTDADFDDIFVRCITADTLGRISVSREKNIEQLHEWIGKYNDVKIERPEIGLYVPTMVVLIGPSGVGKSTFRSQQLSGMEHFNFDQLRVDMYRDQAIEAGMETDSDIYNFCWKQSMENDQDFNKRQRDVLRQMIDNKSDIVVDNTNLTQKARNSTIQQARQKGYQVVAVVFPISMDTLLSRLDSRSDRDMDPGIVINMFKRLTLPSIGRWFDGINVWDGNLWNNSNISNN